MRLALRKYNYRSDAQLVSDLLAGNELAVRYLLYEQYTPLLRMNAQKAAWNKAIDYDDLVQELYLYLSDNNWEKLRRYDPKQPFVNWFSVVSYRFFKDCSRSMIDSDQQVPISSMNDHSQCSPFDGMMMEGAVMMDIRAALAELWPPRDRQILEALLLHDEEPQTVAEQHHVTVDNLYNIKRRAMAKLAQKLAAYK